ncbi:MAG: hypothetical protein ABI273_07020 [Lacunisphaera sp.]
MISAEPTEAEKAMKRVLRISRFNGWSVIIIAALGALITLAMGDISGMAVGVLIAVAGWMEVRGHKLLKKRNPDGMKALVRSQMFLLAIILVYCATRLGSFDSGAVLGNVTPDMESMLKEAGINKADVVPMVRTAFFAGYGIFALLTLFYQGGMALYYRAKTPLVLEALRTLPRPRVSVLPPSV